MNLFIVEDSVAVRKNLKSMLSDIPGLILAGYAEDEMNAIECIDTLLPDIVILDLNLKFGHGINVLKEIKERHAAIKVVVLTNHAGEPYISRCKKAGADYFFDKTFQFLQVHSVLKGMSSCMPGSKVQ